MPRFSFIPVPEAPDVDDAVRMMFDELAATLPRDHRALSGECRPPVDVLETDRHLEVIVDVPGISPTALRVAFRGDVLIIVGEKAPPKATAALAYHLVEREFGRFVRAVRLTGAFDAGAARAQVRNGALSVILPKIDDRRGRLRAIPIDPAPLDSARGKPNAS